MDVVSFGGTKNGLLGAEAVIFLNKDLAQNFRYLRKQNMQLASKMRFMAAQFIAFLENDVWLKYARHSVQMAERLYRGVENISGIQITQPREANAVFAIIPKAALKPLREQFFFYVWDEATFEVRWMTSFDTTAEDVDQFLKVLASTTR